MFSPFLDIPATDIIEHIFWIVKIIIVHFDRLWKAWAQDEVDVMLWDL
jgi:hypothetical protein